MVNNRRVSVASMSCRQRATFTNVPLKSVRQEQNSKTHSRSKQKEGETEDDLRRTEDPARTRTEIASHLKIWGVLACGSRNVKCAVLF
ncbi:hypothetical protein AGIG_G21308 [Arapaima gigas]